ncbi:hypothetical protein [Cohnella boryungensis]|uniref:Lipoprotein n=1 Tax=Cohnella boryungensis TaxID=768479 RepID=A0ABV8SJS0_9BACL
MKKKGQKQALIRTFMLSAILTATLAACSNSEESPSSSPAPVVPSASAAAQPASPSAEPSANESPALEQIATADAQKFLNALKLEDAEKLAGLMAFAENEYTSEQMEQVLTGLRQQFDKLGDLQLKLDSNEQDESYYIENFILQGVREGKESSIPLQVKYRKQDGPAADLPEEQRRPLYDSPYIGLYLVAARDAQRYLDALRQQDADSLAIHLGMDESTEEAKTAVRSLLAVYAGKLDLAAAEVVALGYEADQERYLFELRDGRKQAHGLQVDRSTMLIVDDWAQP